MTDDKQRPKTSAPQQSKRKKRAKKPIYANAANWLPGNFDLTFLAGEYRHAGDEGWIVDEHVRVTLPWGAAKRALFVLAAYVAAYEYQYGHVPVPEHQVPTQPPDKEVGTYAAGSLAVLHAELFDPAWDPLESTCRHASLSIL